MVASQEGHPSVVRILLQEGATVNTTNQVDALVVCELIRNTIICLVYFCKDHFIVNVHSHVWQFKSPFGHLTFLQTEYPHLSVVPRPSHSSISCLQYYLGTRLPTSVTIQTDLISSVQLTSANSYIF